MTDIVTKDLVVVYNYILKSEGEEVVGKEEGHDTPYLHGHGNIFPKVEEIMEGKKVGDTFSITLSAEDGFGKKVTTTPQKVEKSAFPEEAILEKGAVFYLETPDGEVMPFWLTKIEKDNVYLDSNHPLAGQALEFDIEITRIREAKASELEHGHPHGVDGDSGHHH